MTYIVGSVADMKTCLGLMLKLLGFIRNKISINIIKSKWIALSSHRRDKRIIVKAETSQKICHNLIITKRSISNSHFIHKTLYLAEIIIRREITFHGGG
jgi:hypothetical protein